MLSGHLFDPGFKRAPVRRQRASRCSECKLRIKQRPYLMGEQNMGIMKSVKGSSSIIQFFQVQKIFNGLIQLSGKIIEETRMVSTPIDVVGV